MKKVILIVFAVIPFLNMAQNDCNFFDHTIIKVEKTQINTSASDFGPSFVNDQLFYSAFTNEEIDQLSRGISKDIFYNVFSSTIDAEGNVKEGKTGLMDDISQGYHSGPVSYCAKTGELFVTLSNFENPDIKNKVYQKANIRLKIIVVKKEGNNWKLINELPFNNPTYSVGHPAISATGDTLIFASNVPDKGEGETDLYMSVRKNGTWGEPSNLGNKINTAKNEMFPFLFRGNMLFFASNGINESGKLDLYYSCISGNGFSTPVALDKFNTSEDDFGLVIHKEGKVGYFASRREGGLGDDDIYKVTFDKGKFDLELLVQDKISKEPMPNATVRFSDGKIMVTNSAGIITRDLGYDADYEATSEIEGYMNESISFSTSNQPYGTIKKVINVEKVKVGQVFTLENIFYDFDKWDILPESEVELNKLVKIMNDNPDWKVELGSHTDCRGSDSYNELLSQKRSDSAVGYIISKGISKNRIIAKGYGETQLVNHCDDGVDCSEEDHRKNRRTEFKILGMGDN